MACLHPPGSLTLYPVPRLLLGDRGLLVVKSVFYFQPSPYLIPILWYHMMLRISIFLQILFPLFLKHPRPSLCPPHPVLASVLPTLLPLSLSLGDRIHCPCFLDVSQIQHVRKLSKTHLMIYIPNFTNGIPTTQFLKLEFSVICDFSLFLNFFFQLDNKFH